LQPEKGHETLYVVRELRGKRVWFAEPLLSSSADEIRRLIAKARDWAQRLGLPVELWMSDKQDAFVTGIAAEFPDVPHRYCQNHFLRDLAKPLLEQDSHAKVQMRKKVRGLRGIEQQVLEDRRKAQTEAESVRPARVGAPPATRDPATDEIVADGGTVSESVTIAPPSSSEVVAGEPVTRPTAAGGMDGTPPSDRAAQGVSPSIAGAPTAAASPPLLEPTADEAGQVVLDYCAAVRGILNDDQGGPLHPPGLRMASALQDVRASLQRNLEAKKGGAPRSSCASSRAASTGGCRKSPPSKSRSRSTSKR
jgi:hypothetical protein